MSFTLSEVNPETYFLDLITCEWESYGFPLQTFFRLFCPIRGTGPHAREESLAECTARQREWHVSDPSSYWQKVTDSSTGKIIGGALWGICPTNPFEKTEHEDAYWFPEGGEREFVNEALERFETPRATMGQRPQNPYISSHIISHLFPPLNSHPHSQTRLSPLTPHSPAYRRLGAANLILDWGIKKAQEMGVEMWLDATIYGIPLYKKARLRRGQGELVGSAERRSRCGLEET
ncbi:hypothetical protein HYALB_00013597 [Hymenoscyphus albidus]|uniref:N-acetyltransferase domain-containing protein n=1 Tax=Hymenoscyphus albidus TaxID=595503 RepID=A0A9N9QAT1_9HELO|nr:hypothetical protein HYALB_00013597 [Hymenoscyphus albidus]